MRGIFLFKTKRLPVFPGNTTTPYECPARSVDDERWAIFSFYSLGLIFVYATIDIMIKITCAMFTSSSTPAVRRKT